MTTYLSLCTQIEDAAGGNPFIWEMLNTKSLESWSSHCGDAGVPPSRFCSLFPTLAANTLYGAVLDHLTFLPSREERYHLVEAVEEAEKACTERYGDPSTWGPREKNKFFEVCTHGS